MFYFRVHGLVNPWAIHDHSHHGPGARFTQLGGLPLTEAFASSLTGDHGGTFLFIQFSASRLMLTSCAEISYECQFIGSQLSGSRRYSSMQQSVDFVIWQKHTHKLWFCPRCNFQSYHAAYTTGTTFVRGPVSCQVGHATLAKSK